MIQPPMPFKNFRDLGDGYEFRRFLFERIESHRHDRIGGIDHDELLAQVAAFPSLAGVDPAEEERRGISVKIEVDEAAVLLDVLFTHVAQEIALAAAGLAEHDDMSHALAAREGHAIACRAPIHDPKPEVQTAPLEPCSASPGCKAIPNRCDELFEEANHGFNCRRGSANIGNKPKNPRGWPIP